MKIKWLGHASFLITSENGTRIITDPYKTSDNLNYGKIEETADIVTISHEHGDHNNAAAVRGNPKVVRQTTTANSIEIKAIPTSHDEADGSKRGKNTVFCMDIDGIRVCHAGDLGHGLDDKQIAEIGKVDVLLIPIGGFFTIDADTAGRVCDRLKPGIVIPMHYKTDKIDYPITRVDEFLRGKENVTKLETSEIEINRGKITASTQIMVPEPAL